MRKTYQCSYVSPQHGSEVENIDGEKTSVGNFMKPYEKNYIIYHEIFSNFCNEFNVPKSAQK